MNRFLSLLVAVYSLLGYAQSPDDAIKREQELQKSIDFINQNKLNDDRDVVGVAEFKSDIESPYTGLVTEKVVEVLKNSNRVIVVDRTNRDKIVYELEYQKSEEFIGKGIAEQGNSLAAMQLVQGEITKIPVYRMKNPDGTVRGYKASVAFQLKVDNVATQQTTNAVCFEGKSSKECVSAQAAVLMSMNSLEPALSEYFLNTFPLNAKIIKLSEGGNGKAEKVIIKAGQMHGVKVGNRFNVIKTEIYDGEEMPSVLGCITVTNLVGTAFSECKIDKKLAKQLRDMLNSSTKLYCRLVINE